MKVTAQEKIDNINAQLNELPAGVLSAADNRRRINLRKQLKRAESKLTKQAASGNAEDPEEADEAQEQHVSNLRSFSGEPTRTQFVVKGESSHHWGKASSIKDAIQILRATGWKRRHGPRQAYWGGEDIAVDSNGTVTGTNVILIGDV